MNRTIVSLLLTVIAFNVSADPAQIGAMKGGVFTPPYRAPEFHLKGSDGAELSLSRYHGKVVLLGFGFTYCANVCPVTLAILARARETLGAAASDVQVVYITVDPQRDDEERLRKYLRGFDRSFIGGTGTEKQLAAVRDAYGVFASIRTAPGSYSMEHSSFVYFIDRSGLLRGLMPFG